MNESVRSISGWQNPLPLVETLSEGNILGQLAQRRPEITAERVKGAGLWMRGLEHKRAGSSACKLIKVKVHIHAATPLLLSPLPASAPLPSSSPVLAVHLNFSYAQPNNIIINTFSSWRGCFEPVQRCDCARHTSGCAGKPEQRPQWTG